MVRKLLTAAVVASAVALIASACSSSGGGGAGDKGSGADSTSPSAAAGSLAASGSNPIKLMFIGPDVDSHDSQLGAKAAAAAINAAGGVKGRPLEIDVCDDNRDANKAADCVRSATADPNTLAFTGNVTSAGDTIDPLIQKAGMASIGASLVSSADFSSPNVFPTDGGRPLAIVSTTTLCANVLHAKQIGTAYADIPGANAAAIEVQKVTHSLGLPDPKSVGVPLTAADLSAQVAVLSGSDCIVAVMPVDLLSRFIRTARQQGISSPIVTAATIYSPNAINAQLGSSIKGVYIAELYDDFSQGYKEMQAAVGKYEGAGAVGDLTAASASAWLGVHIFADVASKVRGNPDRRGVLNGVRHLSDYNTEGLTTAPLDYTVKATAMGGQVPNLYPSVTGVWPLEYRDGKLGPLNGGKDMKIFG